MKPAGWRTNLAYRLHARWRQLLTWWYGRLADLEDWWAFICSRPVVGLEWKRIRNPPRYRDGVADVRVTVGDPAEMVEAYLRLIHHRPPQEARLWT